MAVKAARKAFESGPWPRLTPSARGVLINKLADAVEKHAEELDTYIETDLERRLEVGLDFEIADALMKLEKAGLVMMNEGRYRVLPLDAAQAKLDALWEHYAKEN